MQPETTDRQLLQLLDKYLKGDCTEKERQQLESWYETFESGLSEEAPAGLPALYDSMVLQLQAEQEWVVPAKKWRGWWKAAAAVLLLIAGSLLVWILRPSGMKEISTLAGDHRQVTLPDGTQVWLNVSSSLKYSGGMKNGRREVYLDGEGYFDVAGSSRYPFIIHTKEITVKVLGTRFNLKTYTGEPLETTLMEGKVAVSLNRLPEKSLQLSPQHKLILTRKSGAAQATGEDWGDFIAAVQPVEREGETETLWQKERMEFYDKSFSELAIIMERWYGKTIILKDASLNSNRFKGTFRREDINRALKALQLTADFNYKIKGDTVIIYK
ncbi:FecR family protein [Chitinophaga solisilvae]|uniref:FecR family protein n=1 Tax=Chitinophaga solisilvae TaxID=1233460 RepID=UPI001368D17D|nr:FecR domain-containing protein [Chitinophaga solisilvae]